jgi:hypothetical protein
VVTTVAHCDGCGRPAAHGDHTVCLGRRATTDPPRFCVTCGRKLVVQVLPMGWTARCVHCGPVPGGPQASEDGFTPVAD